MYRIVCFVVFTGCEGWFGVQDCLFCCFHWLRRMVRCTGLFVLFVLTGCEGWFSVQNCLFCLF